MKPHIRMINGRWWCCGMKLERPGITPTQAFWVWWLALDDQVGRMR